MAYVNVKEWSPDQVTEWLRGLDNVILPYINSFLNNEVKGHQLLSLRSDDLEHLGVYTLGHQELILEAVEQLRNFHYELDRENLQLLALRLSCAARSLYNELLSAEDSSKIETQTMSDVANIITTIKPLVCWLDRAPFSGQGEYLDRKTKLLQLSLEMATCAQRDRFAEQPVEKIRSSCRALAQLADNIIQEISDPMLLQPASLDLATLKKKENELGFSLMPSYHGVHQIAEIKFTSPAHTSSKLEEGDEIVQVNYQTVVGWQRKKVLGLFQESPPDIVLTLKKRPRHTKVYGQIYMKPYRLPSKKRATPYSRWNDNLPSPRPELLTIPDFEMPLPRLPAVVQPQPLESESSSDSEPPDSPLESQGRVYPLKPRPVLQRRNTITGASPTSKRPHQAIEQYWNELKHQAAYKHSSSTYIETDNYKRDSVYLRDKSASCGHGLELTQRPATYPKKFDKTLLITDPSDSKTDGKKRVNFEDRKVIFEEKSSEYTFDQRDPKTSGSISKRDIEPKTRDELNSRAEISSSSDISKISVLKESNFASHISNLNYCDSYEQSLEKSISVNSLTSLSHSDEPIKFIDETVDEMYDRSHMNAEWKNEIIEELIGSLKKSCLNLAEGVGNNTTPTNSPEKSVGDKSLEMLQVDSKGEKPVAKPATAPRNQIIEGRIMKKPPEIPAKPEVLKKPAVPPRNFTTRVTRGRLDKSHSTPAYDTTQEGEKIVLDQSKTPEILITGPEPLESPFEPKMDPKKKEADAETTTPVVETISSALGDIRHSYTEIKAVEPSESLQKNANTLESAKLKFESGHRQELRKIPEVVESSKVEPPKYMSKAVDTPPEPPPRTLYGQTTEMGKMKHFEPKSVSTPVSKTPMMEFPNVDTHKSVSEVSKASSETKISPTNSVVRAMISKNKSTKKKNNVIAKRRKVTVKDLNPCDIQGYLYQRLRNRHTQNFHWEKRWFVLLGSCLYGFKTKDALKAECLIFLTGFTVALAQEVKSRLHAFKVYHTGTAFYFSAENFETMTSWVELITVATLHSDGVKPSDNALFSETDDSDSDKPKTEGKEKSESSRKFGSLKKFTSKKSSDSNTTHNESTSLDRKYLRFFNNSGSKTPKNQLPVPTPQFRSYRKVVPPNLVVNQNAQISSSFISKKPEVVPKPEAQQFPEPNLNLELAPKTEAANSTATQKSGKLKPKPINYIHASNPSLCDINDFRFQNFYHKTRQFTQRTENLTGFVTLEQFMLNRQEEERKQNLLFGRSEDVQINPNSIQPDVVYGEVRGYNHSGDSRIFEGKQRKDDYRKHSDPQALKVDALNSKKTHSRTNSDGYTDLYYDKQRKSITGEGFKGEGQSRTLPKLQSTSEVKVSAANLDGYTDLHYDKQRDKFLFGDQSRPDEGQSRTTTSPDGYTDLYYDKQRKYTPGEGLNQLKAGLKPDNQNRSEESLKPINPDGYTDLYYDRQRRGGEGQSRTLPKTEKLPSFEESQSRSLPRSPERRAENALKYEDRSELVSDIKMAEPYELQYADKKSLKLQKMQKDRSYELVYCPQKKSEVQFAQNRPLDASKKYAEAQRKCEAEKRSAEGRKASKLTRQHSLNSADKKEGKIFARGESPEKFWLDSLRRSEKISDKGCAKVRLKSATQYTPMCLPLTPDQKGKLNPKFAFELNLDEKSGKGGKFKGLFGKQSDDKKEKTLLGSPRLHRALFRKNHPPETETRSEPRPEPRPDADWSDAPQVVLPYSTTNVPPPNPRPELSPPSVAMPTPPDYPGLEYPPVFEPETYSLANPSCSLTILRKQQQK